MLGIFYAIRSALRLSTPPARFSRILRGPDREPIGTVDLVRETPEGIEIRGTIEGPAALLLAGAAEISASFDAKLLEAAHRPTPGIDGLLALHGHPPLQQLVKRPPAGKAIVDYGMRRPPLDHISPRPLVDAENIRQELRTADPRPDLERVRALADYSSTTREGHDEQEFAWAAFTAAGGSSMTPWRAFEAGLRAAADRLRS